MNALEGLRVYAFVSLCFMASGSNGSGGALVRTPRGGLLGIYSAQRPGVLEISYQATHRFETSRRTDSLGDMTCLVATRRHGGSYIAACPSAS